MLMNWRRMKRKRHRTNLNTHQSIMIYTPCLSEEDRKRRKSYPQVGKDMRYVQLIFCTAYVLVKISMIKIFKSFLVVVSLV